MRPPAVGECRKGQVSSRKLPASAQPRDPHKGWGEGRSACSPAVTMLTGEFIKSCGAAAAPPSALRVPVAGIKEGVKSSLDDRCRGPPSGQINSQTSVMTACNRHRASRNTALERKVAAHASALSRRARSNCFANWRIRAHGGRYTCACIRAGSFANVLRAKDTGVGLCQRCPSTRAPHRRRCTTSSFGKCTAVTLDNCTSFVSPCQLVSSRGRVQVGGPSLTSHAVN
jgi:hypothetical protein